MTGTSIDDTRTKTPVLAENLLLIFSVIGTVFILVWVFWYCRYGIDFSDESFYLVWMSTPFNYSASATQFGFIYHPLYELLKGNIAALRQTNILITYCLSWVLCNIFLKNNFFNQSLHIKNRIVISGAVASVAITSFIYAGLWLPTPSYNHLALQALLVVAIGLLLADKHDNIINIIGWFLIGAGGWLAFMAKPTTAAAIGLCAMFYLLFSGKFSIRLLAISIGTAIGFTILSAFVIDGSIIGFIQRLKDGTDMYKILAGGHSGFLRLDSFDFSRESKLIFFLFMGLIFFSTYFSQSRVKALANSATALSIMFGLFSFAIIFGIIHKTINAGTFQSLLICSIPFAVILVGFTIYRFKGPFKISRLQSALALTFLMFPYAYAFGTNGNYWILIGAGGIFWVLVGLVFLNLIARNIRFPALLLSIGFAVQLISVILIHNGFESPYRQPLPLRTNSYKINIGKQGSNLILSEDYAQYTKDIVSVADRAGFKKGTPMIDLTGKSPGVLYAIGASNIGQPWTVGGYPGSDALAEVMLRKVECKELAMAWLLIEPENPNKISPNILSSFGASIAKDYESVGMFKAAKGVGGCKEIRIQKILKPIKSFQDAEAACFSERALKQ
ncbi:MAG: hypothetical protein KKE11_04255 [Gammaproteobacteria bacterium]|nr:hypothetical protein [Gammaproteobacteria bacterium]